MSDGHGDRTTDDDRTAAELADDPEGDRRAKRSPTTDVNVVQDGIRLRGNTGFNKQRRRVHVDNGGSTDLRKDHQHNSDE